jgi:hypothetical protein
VAARELPPSGDTNSAVRDCALNRARCTGAELLSVRRTGAMQCQRESSTEPHTKNVEMYRCHEARENFRPCLPSNFGGVANRQWGTGVLRTGRRLGDSSLTVYVHMDDMNQKSRQERWQRPSQEPATPFTKRTIIEWETLEGEGAFDRFCE